MTIHQLIDKVRPGLTRPGVEITLVAELEADPRLFDGMEFDGEKVRYETDDRKGIAWTVKVDREPVLYVMTGFDNEVTSIRPGNAQAEVAIETARQFGPLMSDAGVPDEVPA